MEIWKDIEGYEGLYQVSNYGRVRSLDRLVRHSGTHTRIQKGKIIKPGHDAGGYCVVHLWRNNIQKPFKIHRYVALYFVNNPHQKPEVNHIDENKDNNAASNLEWVTRKENENYGTKQQRKVANTNYKEIARKNSKKIVQFDINGNVIKVWNSAKTINNELGYSTGNICNCCKGKINPILYGYRWAYG